MATAAVREAVDFTADATQEAVTSAQQTTRSAANRVQNTLHRVRQNDEAEDMVQIHQNDPEAQDQSQEEQQQPQNRHPLQNLLEDSHMVKEPTRWGVAMHDISFSGLGGGMFILMLVSLVISTSCFASVGWSYADTHDKIDPEMDVRHHIGLWEQCVCTPTKELDNESWFRTTQAMITIGFIFSWLAMVCITMYMCLCLHAVKKTYLLFGVISTTAFAVLFYFIGLVVYGAEEMRALGWSYGLSYVSTIMCVLTGIFAVLQLKRSVQII